MLPIIGIIACNCALVLQLLVVISTEMVCLSDSHSRVNTSLMDLMEHYAFTEFTQKNECKQKLSFVYITHCFYYSVKCNYKTGAFGVFCCMKLLNGLVSFTE